MDTLCAVSIYLLIQAVHSEVWYGSHFLCHGRNGCYDDQMHCIDNIKCIVDCYGPNACQYAIIHCPIDAACDINCAGGYDSCKDVVFLAKHSTSLSITCDRSQSEAFDETLIYCPDNGPGGPKQCHISGVSEVNVKAKMEIFAVEGLNDVEISGSYINTAIATVYCKNDYSSRCTLIQSSPFNECISTATDKTCESYLQPTLPPTVTQTSEPTVVATHPQTTDPTVVVTHPHTTEPAVVATHSQTTEPTAVATHPQTTEPAVVATHPQTTETTEPTAVATHPQTTYIYTTLTEPAVVTTHPQTTEPTAVATHPQTTEPTTATPIQTPEPTRRPINLQYTPPPTSINPYTPRPTRAIATAIGGFETTTTQADGALIFDYDIDTENEGKTDYTVLYYVIGALLISICYISVSLCFWVHFNEKYSEKVIELKRRNSDAMLKEAQTKQYENRPRFMTASVASSAAPTTEPKAPTTTTSRSRCSTSVSFSKYSNESGATIIEEKIEEDGTMYCEAPVIIEEEEDEDEEFKEVDYETAHKGENMRNTYMRNRKHRMPQSPLSLSTQPVPSTYVPASLSSQRFNDFRNGFPPPPAQ